VKREIQVTRHTLSVVACASTAILLSSCGGLATRSPSVPAIRTSTTLSTAALSDQAYTQSPRTMQFVNDQDGWLVTGSYTMMATTDGGRTWSKSYSGPAQLGDLDFVGPNDGWVRAYDPNELLRTSDGGLHWTAIAEPPGVMLTRIDFVGPTTGWALTNAGTLLKTADGGARWTKVSAPLATSLCVGASGRLWLGTAAATVDDSVNNGRTWHVSLPWGTVSQVLSEQVRPWVTCSGSGAWALYDLGEAAGSSEYVVFATGDSGSHWTPRLVNNQLGPSGSFPNVSNSVANDGASGGGSAWFLGLCGPCDGLGTAEIVTATGASVSRTTQLPEATIEELDAAFADPAHGWVVSTDSGAPNPSPSGGEPTLKVQATSDGGATWSTIATIPGAP
jgi:hypothetical protein